MIDSGQLELDVSYGERDTMLTTMILMFQMMIHNNFLCISIDTHIYIYILHSKHIQYGIKSTKNYIV